VLTIGRHSITEAVVAVCPQQCPQHIFERRPDEARDIERFAGIMAERTQCGPAACGNARLRIDQRSVEIQEDAAGRGHARP
jgi:hypothetical protein